MNINHEECLENFEEQQTVNTSLHVMLYMGIAMYMSAYDNLVRDIYNSTALYRSVILDIFGLTDQSDMLSTSVVKKNFQLKIRQFITQGEK